MKEKLAALQHEIWAHWMKYLFSVSKQITVDAGEIVVISPDKVAHWLKQIDTPYSNLTEKEKESDRDQADKIIKLLSNQPQTQKEDDV